MVAAAAVVGTLGLTASAQEQQLAAPPTAAASERLPCTTEKQPANFRPYSLGPSFNGHKLIAVLRRCDDPYPGEPARANYVSYIYGDCQFPVDPATGLVEGGCAPPIEIQTWPACERSPADYTLEGQPYPRENLGLRRGVPATRFDDATRMELSAGKSTIAIFGEDPAEVNAATAAVRPEPTNTPPTKPLDAGERQAAGLPGPAANLPSPPVQATAGELPCSG